ncbi:hypothetical protein HY498_01360 [Candidatus Woesearchaeota archaeon]|nr:hypothetical protein [Candidatus Woesearchaeota archaeon]
MEYWHDLITEKSWNVLQQIKKDFDFVLIGGWAIYFYTKGLKSKDIDVIIDFDNLNEIRKKYDIKKNDHLKKYEIKVDDIDIDIYVKNFSELPVPVEEIEININLIENYRVVKPEILLILKQAAEFDRGHSEKGLKDRIDIMNLLINGNIDFDFYNELIERYRLNNFRSKLIDLTKNFNELNYLNLNVKEYKNIKLKLLKKLK